MLSILLFILLFTAFLPYGTDVPCERKPVVTVSIIGVAVAVHFMLLVVMVGSGSVGGLLGSESAQTPTAADGLRQMMENLSFMPARLRMGSLGAIVGAFTAPWFHVHFFHMLFNVWVFYIFGANVENLFGRRRFGAMLLAAVIVSALGALPAVGKQGAVDGETFRGMDGLTAAVAGAYLVCFPRSHVKIVLILAPLFWLVVFFIIAPVTSLSRLFFPTDLSQVLAMGLFLALFAAMQPTRSVFGLPALVFFAVNIFLRLPVGEMGGINFSSAQTGIYAGGFLAGAVAGVLVNGLKGFGERYSVEDDPRAYVTAAMRRRMEEARLQADGTSPALRELLGRRVFTGDAPEAVRLYTEEIYPHYPELSLEDPQLQLALARMLAARRVDLPALRAYELLLAKSGLGEVETTAVCLEGAAVCVRVPQSVDTGREFLARLKDVTLTQRDRDEVRRLQDLLAQVERAADGKAVQATSRAESKRRPPVAQADDEAPPEGLPTVAPRLAGRMQALETLVPHSPDEPKPTKPSAPERESAPPISPPDRSVGPFDPPRPLSELGIYPAKPRSAEVAYGGLPLVESTNEPWAVILPGGPKDDPADLYACLRDLWRDDQRARRAVESSRGVAGRNLARGDAEDLVARLARHGLVGKAVVQPGESVTMPPIAEAVELTEDKLRVRVGVKWSEFDLVDLAWVGLAKIKLSAKSRSARGFADLWFGGEAGRIWLPLEGLSGERWRIHGEPCAEADAATQLLGALQKRIQPEHLASTWRDAQGDIKNAPIFDTMMTYENAVLWELLMRSEGY